MKTPTQEPRKKKSFRIDRSVVIVAAMVAIGVLLISVVQMTSLSARESQEREARRKRIENMSAEQREQLARKSKLFFEEFDEDKRQAYRDLHEGIENSENKDALRKTLRRYNAWLATLSPYERDELRDKLAKASSTDERQRIIRTAKDLQDEKKWIRTLPRSERSRLARLKRDSPEYKQAIMRIRSEQEQNLALGQSQTAFVNVRKSWGVPGPRLNSQALDSFLNLFLEKMNLSDARKSELKTVPAMRRRVQILHEAVKLYDPPEGTAVKGFLDDESLKQMLSRTSLDAQSRERLAEYADLSKTDRWGLLRVLVYSTMRVMFMRAHKPTEEELNKFLTSMEPEERMDLLRFRGDELRRALEIKYSRHMHQRRGISYAENKELFNSLDKLRGWRRTSRGPGVRKGPSKRTGRRGGTRERQRENKEPGRQRG